MARHHRAWCDAGERGVTMCRTETMTGQTMVIDSGRYFH
jgi:hypothetical protein